ncbi:hypothetical protein L228DRAFT_245453 [Xylona heveae TC161]|uniref:Tyrosine specific protein phosphatases domain-containing protein n=1 Tax=Xylona heveae (strain CBS 132557 / TC161) TaxID=1328760 RepID=A0A165I7N7_XYLHT|nr:hypothetical protein L228DRAFT_245453 [Xylona heveae TC161]KZF24504.1 hypothetical protein L228DRAFT_245453 [Xylona heveae TC161]
MVGASWRRLSSCYGFVVCTCLAFARAAENSVAAAAAAAAAATDTTVTTPAGRLPASMDALNRSLQAALSVFLRCFRQLVLSLHQTLARACTGQLNITDVVRLTVLCGVLPGIWLMKQRICGADDNSAMAQRSSLSAKGKDDRTIDGDDGTANVKSSNDLSVEGDPPLLKKHSFWRTYVAPVPNIQYRKIRIFYKNHPQIDKLPSKPRPMPLLVFIHGLGGSIAQFVPLLNSLVNIAPCLGIDLPGCGLSEFAPTSWRAYSIDALADLVAAVIAEYRDQFADQGVILIGHSMGCSIATLLASSTSKHPSQLSKHILGFVAICPQSSPPPPEKVSLFRKALSIPTPIFDLWRRWDRRGGTESPSVQRFVGPDADLDTKKLQVLFNEQSKTAVWRRMAWGALPRYHNGIAKGGLPGKDTWAGLDVPVLLIAGDSDKVTRPEEVDKIEAFLRKPSSTDECKASISLPDSAAPIDTAIFEKAEDTSEQKEPDHDKLPGRDIDESLASSSSIEHTPPSISTVASLKKPPKVIKVIKLPSPASHALLYSRSTTRTLIGLVTSFLSSSVDSRLSQGWQLLHLSTGGKWDVKNLVKWQAVEPVSGPIGGVFRAMKTLRAKDEKHCPEVFVDEWDGKVSCVVDISLDTPVYDTAELENGGIHYHKFPTVSKIPPTVNEVKDFILLIDSLKGLAPDGDGGEKPLIGVHCHYGFNRTGFFIVSYLVERQGFKLQDALDEFKKQRPPGIRHDHFIDTLFMRYCSGLKRHPTL